MDISNASREQKASAAVAFLSKNPELAPDGTQKELEKLIKINSEGMDIVKQIQSIKAQMEALDAELGQKLGGAKMLFELIGEKMTPEQIDEFASKFEPKQFQVPENAPADMAGATAPKSTIITPPQGLVK